MHNPICRHHLQMRQVFCQVEDWLSTCSYFQACACWESALQQGERFISLYLKELSPLEVQLSQYTWLTIGGDTVLIYNKNMSPFTVLIMLHDPSLIVLQMYKVSQ